MAASRDGWEKLKASWNRWMRLHCPAQERRRWRQGALTVHYEFMQSIGVTYSGAGLALALVRPLMTSEWNPIFPLVRIVDLKFEGTTLPAEPWADFLAAAADLGARGILLDRWRFPAVNGPRWEPWNTHLTAQPNDGLLIYITPIGYVMQQVDTWLQAVRMHGASLESAEHAALTDMDPMVMAHPWCEALRSILHTVQAGAAVEPSVRQFCADTLARGRFTWDKATGELDFVDLLYCGRSPHHATVGLWMLRALGSHLGANRVRIPWESGLYSWAANPETHIHVDATADPLSPAIWHTLRALEVARAPLPPLATPKDVTPGLLARFDKLRFSSPDSDKMDFKWTFPGGSLEAALVMDLLLPLRSWRKHMGTLQIRSDLGPPAFLIDAKRDSARDLERIWDYLLAQQIVRTEAPPLQHEMGQRLGGDGDLRLVWATLTAEEAPDKEDILDTKLILSLGANVPYDKDRPVRILRVASFSHLSGHMAQQPAFQAEIRASALTLHRVLARFVTINARVMAPRHDRYRIAIVYEPVVYNAIATLLVGTPDAKWWNRMESYHFDIMGCNPHARKPLKSDQVRVVHEDYSV